MKIESTAFGKNATLYTLENDNGIKLGVTDFGARIVNLLIPTENGEKNLILGFDSADEYAEKDTYIGATIGRVAGRITDGKADIAGTSYQFPKNNSGNTLHGGPDSFEVKTFTAETEENTNEAAVIFSYISPDGENDFPGELHLSVRYSLNNDDEWTVSYTANTDKATLFNPTNHVYFNLTGDVTQSVDNHQLTVAADKFVVLGEGTLATGELRDVKDTPFDFRQGNAVKQAFETDYEQNTLVKGLDHPFVLTETSPQAVLTAPAGDISIEMTTDEPAVVIFTAQFGETPEMRGEKLAYRGGITLETQVMPGALEYGFGDIVLQPEDTFTSSTTYKIVKK